MYNISILNSICKEKKISCVKKHNIIEKLTLNLAGSLREMSKMISFPGNKAILVGSIIN